LKSESSPLSLEEKGSLLFLRLFLRRRRRREEQ
jgi:hypothetical protein